MRGLLQKLARAGGRVWLGVAVCLVLSVIALPFDHAVSDRVRLMTAGHTGELVRFVGGFGHALTLSVIFVVLLVLYGEERTGIHGLIAVLGGGVVTDVLKTIFGRPRPDGSSDAFPSGHATCAFAAAFVLARRWPRHRYAFYLGAAGVAAARVLWLRHFPGDVLAGAAVGMAAGAAAAVLVDGMAVLTRPRAMLRVKVVLGAMLVISVFVVGSWPEPIATLAPPALLLVVAHRIAAMLGPRLSYDG